MTTALIEYTEGDVIVQAMHGDWFRDVLVDETYDHGASGFVGWRIEESCDGELVKRERVWGHSYQVVRNIGPTIRNDDFDLVYA